MLPAIRRSITSVICLVAVACASFAWTAIVYLRTWADPATPARVVSAVLDDADAREEVVAPLRQGSPGTAESVGDASRIDAAIDAVFADPASRARIADAYAPSGGDGVQPRAAVDALVGEVADLDATLGSRVAAVGPELSLPNVSAMTSLRSTAERWAWRTALVAVVLFAVAFVAGDRRLAARRYGWWAFGTGVTWWLVPLLLTAAARRWLPSFDATTSVVVDAYVRPVRPWAIGLAVSGLVAVFLGVFVVGRGSTSTTAAAERHPYPPRSPVGIDDTAPTSVTVWSSDPSADAPTTLTVWPSDPGVTESLAHLARADRAPASSCGIGLDDVDVWAAYATPAPAPAPEVVIPLEPSTG